MSLIATEAYLDIDREGMSAESLITDLIGTAPKLLHCKSCGRLVVLRESAGKIDAKFYSPDEQV